ncbi:MAG: hypothetical protein JXO72_11700 [Vicinamibacteria bacterium]|nr:hypothetical protein [Vicinamibacteria bacterium]
MIDRVNDMKRACRFRRYAFIILVCAGIHHAPRAMVQAAPATLPGGQIVDAVACLHDSKQSYALYLPSSYSKDRLWPILYAFDPAARGRVPVERFKDSAERLGYIVVGSNNSRNGPQEPNVAAIEAILRDTHARLSLDPKRVYATGMSGGSYPATLLVASYGAGVITCAGPTQVDPTAKDAPRFAWLAVAGDADFNWSRNKELVRTLSGRGCVARFAAFEGGHGWPPADVVARAMDWLDLLAMRDGSRPADTAFVDAYLASGVARAQSAIALGRFDDASEEYAALARELRGLKNVDDIESEARRLSETREAKRDRKSEAKLVEEELKQTRRLFDIFGRLERPGQDSQRQELSREISRLQHDHESEETDRRLVARRVLGGFHAGTSQAGSDNISKGNYEAAKVDYEVCLEVHPENAFIRYQLARAQAGCRKSKEALAELRRAVDAGFGDVKSLDGDSEWEPLRNDAEYHEIVGRIGKKQL